MKKQIFVTAHACGRIRNRKKIPLHVSRAEMLKLVFKSFEERQAEIARAIKTQKAFQIDGENFYFCPLYSPDGDALLLKSYWAGEATGLKKIKLVIKRFLLRQLNEW